METEHEAANVCSQFVSIGRSFRANQSWKQIGNFQLWRCFVLLLYNTRQRWYSMSASNSRAGLAVLLHRAAGNLRHWVPLTSLFMFAEICSLLCLIRNVIFSFFPMLLMVEISVLPLVIVRFSSRPLVFQINWKKESKKWRVLGHLFYFDHYLNIFKYSSR